MSMKMMFIMRSMKFMKPQIKQNFHDQIFAGIENNLRTQFYEKAIQQAVYEQALGKAESEATDEEKAAAERAG